MALAALPWPDLAAAGLLLLFALWGARRGSLVAALGLALLAVAFPLAGRLGPRLEEAVFKVASVQPADVRLYAWAAAGAGVLLAGGLLLTLLRPMLARITLPGSAERTVGAVLGLVQGLVVGTVLLYGACLARPDGRGWAADLEASPSARGARAVARAVRAFTPPPPWLERRLEEVDLRIPTGR